MSHDYSPEWDYPVIELSSIDSEEISDSEKSAIERVIERVRKDLAPSLTFEAESTFEVFFAETLGISDEGDGVVAVYCNGTASRPVVGFDLVVMKYVAEVEGLDFIHQFELSLAHELGHAYQESLGLDHDHEDGEGGHHGFDEDDAEAFGRAWADDREISLWLLNPELARPGAAAIDAYADEKSNDAEASGAQTEPGEPGGLGEIENLEDWIQDGMRAASGHKDWPAVLVDAREITQFMAKHATDEIEEESVEEYFFGSQAVLVRLPLYRIGIDEARKHNNTPSMAKENRYAKLSSETVPPILLDETGNVEDGHHRRRVALQRGDTSMLCYVVIDADIDLGLKNASAVKRKMGP